MNTPEPPRQRILTALGPAQVRVFAATGAASGTLLLGHGAGGGRDAADLMALTGLTEQGWTVVLVDQPWRVAGRRIATAPPTLDQAWLEITDQLAGRDTAPDGTPLPRPWVFGGRSAGARVACRTSVVQNSTAPRVAAVLCLAFPLHPPGRPERSRAPELAQPLGAGLHTLVINGLGDPMGTPAQIREALAGRHLPGFAAPVLHGVPGAHSPSRDLASVLTHAREFLQEVSASVGPDPAAHQPGHHSRSEESG